MSTEEIIRGLDLTAEFYMSGAISPTSLTANQNDYSPTGLSTASAVRQATDATPRTITGLLAPASGGRVIAFININAATAIDLNNEDAGSAAANRFALGANVSLSAGQGVILWYDFTSSRWRLVTGSGGGGGVPTSRTLTAGTGMTGTGDLSADRTFNVVANADGSIIANADDIQVGVLANDTQHGTRGGGTVHAVTVTSVNGAGGSNGFLTAFDKEKLNQFKVKCRVASTGNLTLSGTQTIDGAACIAGDRILVRVQTTGTQNGIYDVAAGAWARSFDAAVTGDLTTSLVVMTTEGTLFNDIFWTLSNATNPVIGTDTPTFVALSGTPSNTAPDAVAAAAVIGTSAKFSREDHVHTIGANVVADTMLRQGAATSIIGRSANSTGNVADIAASADGQVLQRIAGALSWATLATATTTAIKTAARAMTTANIALSAPQTVDGVSAIAGDRVLVKNQSTASQNGIYDVAAGAWTRSSDMAASADINGTTLVPVQEGTTGADTVWCCTTNNPITLGTTATVWSQLGGIASTTTPGNVGTAAIGTSPTWAHSDHVHNIAAAYVTRAMMANGTATSIIGRSANSSGVTADIAATADRQVLQRSGAALVWATLNQAKSPVRAATTVNITLSAPQTIDGISIIAAERVLVKNQSTASQNGIYDCAAGAWTRSSDMNVSADIVGGTTVYVQEGTLNADTLWGCTNDGAITLATTSLVFAVIQAGSATPVSIAAAAVVGTVNRWSREDHTHTIGTNVVANTMFRQGGATSVVGVTGNATANVADIAATEGQFLRRSNNALAFAAWAARYVIPATAFESPNNADYPVNALAPVSTSPTNGALATRRFDDTTEEGVGFQAYIPAGATTVNITWNYQAQTAPAAARTCGSKLYYRAFTNNAAMAAAASFVLTDLAVNANNLLTTQSQTFLLTAPTTALVADTLYHFEWTRPNPVGGTELVGDLALLNMMVEFY